MKRSKVWKYTKEEFQELLNTCVSYSELLDKMELKEGSYKVIKARIKEENLDSSFIDNNPNKYKNKSKHISDNYSLDKVLVENSTYARHALKKRLIEENLIEYKCNKCGNDGNWQGEKLSLQLEHINGVNNDNRLENLVFLCPNCHSQTDTYAGKSKNKNTDIV